MRVALDHLYMDVFRVFIYEAEKLTTWGSVDQLVNPWQQIHVLRACLIQIREVDTHPPLSIAFFSKALDSPPRFETSFPPSCLIGIDFSSPTGHRFWAIGLMLGWILCSWEITSLLTSGMSLGFQANNSLNSIKSIHSVVASSYDGVAPICTTFPGHPLPISSTPKLAEGNYFPPWDLSQFGWRGFHFLVHDVALSARNNYVSLVDLLSPFLSRRSFETL